MSCSNAVAVSVVRGMGETDLGTIPMLREILWALLRLSSAFITIKGMKDLNVCVTLRERPHRR
jgi:hypothetical protein